MTALAIVASILAVVGWIVALYMWLWAHAEHDRADRAEMELADLTAPADRWAALRLADAKVREASRQAGRWTP